MNFVDKQYDNHAIQKEKIKILYCRYMYILCRFRVYMCVYKNIYYIKIIKNKKYV